MTSSVGNRQVTVEDNGSKLIIESDPGEPGDDVKMVLKKHPDGSLSGKVNLIFRGTGGKSVTKGRLLLGNVNGNTITGTVLFKPKQGGPFEASFTLTKNN